MEGLGAVTSKYSTIKINLNTYLSMFSVSATCDHLTGVGVEWRGEVVDVKVLHKQNIPDTFVSYLPRVRKNKSNMTIIT